MVHPGQYPNNPARNQPMSVDEFREVLCVSCGAHRRTTLTWVEQLVHRFKSAITAVKTQQAWFCLGCGIQVDAQGDPVRTDDPGFVTNEERQKLQR